MTVTTPACGHTGIGLIEGQHLDSAQVDSRRALDDVAEVFGGDRAVSILHVQRNAALGIVETLAGRTAGGRQRIANAETRGQLRAGIDGPDSDISRDSSAVVIAGENLRCRLRGARLAIRYRRLWFPRRCPR